MHTRTIYVRRALQIGLTWIAGLAICWFDFTGTTFSDALARGPSIGRGGGGGGARPGGGGGARPGGGMSRPTGGMSRPSPGMSRPSGGGARPGGIAGGGSRPNLPSNRPSLGNVGNSRPSMPNNISRPGGGIGNASRPSLGGIGGPGGVGGGNLSGPGNVQRPSFGNPSIGNPSFGNSGIAGNNRPSFGNIGDRPSAIQLPSTRPGAGSIAGIGNRPGIGDRPGIGNQPGIGNRPGIDNRPGVGNRPGIDNRPGERPDFGNRPGIDNRPGIGNRPGIDNRPIIGGGNRPGNGNVIIGGGNNIIGGGNINNRPGGDWWSQNHNGNWNHWNNWNGNNWHNHWHDNWHNNCINGRYGWYNGCWNNNWGGGWYAPIAYGAVGWGLGSWYNSYAYGGSSYYNPYYDTTAVASVPYDYSQPVNVNYYSQDTYAPATTTVDNTTVGPQPAPPPNNAAQDQFDQGLALFKAGKYRESLPQFDAALRQLPKDPVVHEVRALNLFALGQYQQAAASLNALLATAPGMDWTTMSGLYGNLDDYKQQLKALEDHCRANRTDSPAAFVLAYHYLVNGHQDAAVNALKAVVRQQPKDVIAKRMLDSLSPPAEATPSTTTPPPAADPTATAPQTDLVGSWQAKAGDSVIELTIGDDSQFTWKATQKGQPAVELQGGLTASSDTLILESKSQGSMIGKVKSVSPDKWQFAMAGGTSSDAQLTFERAK